MKHLLLTTIAAVVLVGCRPSMSIHKAALDGNIEAVKQHLDAGKDVNAKTERGFTPLHVAANYGRKEIVELLIAEGADVNAKNEDKWTPLYESAFRGHKEIAELLIEKDADVNAKHGLNGSTPLHGAAYDGHKEIVELLIAKGADVNAKIERGGFKGGTPLDLATHLDNPSASAETADLLRKHGGKTAEELKAEGK